MALTRAVKHLDIISNVKRHRGTFMRLCEDPKYNERKYQYDVAIVGGGIIGAAVAKVLKEKAEIKVALIEKENSLGKHQTNHNSGVIHSGVYYNPGSLKAALCVPGADLLNRYCVTKNIPHITGGKLIVATDYVQLHVLKEFYERGKKNNVPNLTMLNTMEEIMEIEPLAKGIQGLWVPSAGNVNFKEVTENFGMDFLKRGGDIVLSTEVSGIEPSDISAYPILLKCVDDFCLEVKYIIICSGLQSNTLTKLIDKTEHRTFVSFRVEYQKIHKYIPTNIYAVSNPDMPFLGVHISPLSDASGTLLGPSAVLANNIEGYKKEEINLKYLKNILSAPAFHNMLVRYFPRCYDQIMRDLCPDLTVKDVQKLAHIQEIVKPGPVAVQCQLLNEDGSFVDDFVFEFFESNDEIRRRVINCKFLPSPAATSCLSIAEYVSEHMLRKLREKL